MNLNEYARYDAMGLAELVRKGEVSSSELAELANQAIDKLNPTLNFIAQCMEPEQLNGAEQNYGTFQGVPFLLKEGCASIKGQPFNIASRIAVGHRAKADNEVVKRFRQTGLSFIGQSTAPEAGNAPTTESVLHGPTRNPWNPDYMPGGSSGGSAAAVAAGVMPIAHATDGAGSIRIPAACCGLVGIKPTRARTPGKHDSIFGLTVNHILSRTVRDSAMMLDCLQGPEVGGLYFVSPPERTYFDEVGRAPKPLKIAFTTQSPSGERVHPDCIAGVEATVKVCADMGHHIEENAPIYDWQSMLVAFIDLYSYKHPLFVETMEASTGRKLGPDTRESGNLAMLAHAEQLSMLDFAQHIMDLTQICQQVGGFFTEYDVLISPVMNKPALPIGEMNANAPDLTASSWFEQQFSQYASFTPIYNATGQPAMSLPLFHSEAGLPVGVQLAARHGDEATLFQLAGQLEQAMPWQQRKPEISAF